MRTCNGLCKRHWVGTFVAVGVLAFCLGVQAIPPGFERALQPVGDTALTDEDVQALASPPLNVTARPQPRVESLDAPLRSMDERNDALSPAVTTGGDNCNQATVVPLTVGPPGFPNTITLTGDNSAATGPDCAAHGSDPLWWEAFETDKCAKVTLDFCGTTPRQSPTWAIIWGECPCDDAIIFDSANRDDCHDGNLTLTFNEVPPGTWYYPVLSNDALLENPRGPYVIHVSAEECVGACTGCLGACCNTGTETCTEDVAEDTCTGPNEQYTARARCCEVECRDPAGPEFDASGVKLLSRVPLADFSSSPLSANDVWGYVSPSGREYALIGLECSVGVVEVTNPAVPVIVGEIPGPCSTVRDMAVFGQYAYAIIGVVDGLQVINLTNVDGGVISHTTTDLGIGYTVAHNVYANPDSGYLYLAIPNTNGGLGLTVADLNIDPANPSFAGFWTDDPGVRCHDVLVVSYTSGPNAGKEIAFCPAENNGLKIADVTNKASMFTLSTLLYPNTAYAHQGWLSEDRQFFFLGDEGDESNFGLPTTTYVIDVSDLSQPQLVTTFTNGLCAIDHNMMVRGSNLYQANYSTGLRVYNVSDVNNIQEVGHFDTHPESNVTDFDGAWGVYAALPSGVILLSDRERGLFVLDVSQAVVGACCNVITGLCEDDVLEEDCQGDEQQWVKARLCADIDCESTIPTVSQWGLIVMTLLTLSAGTVVLRRRAAAGARG